MNYTSRLFDQKGYEENLHLGLFGGLADDHAYFQTLNDLFSGIDANNLLGMAKPTKKVETEVKVKTEVESK